MPGGGRAVPARKGWVRARSCVVCVFFFQAEDGIRVGRVTGVQTCALPISPRCPRPPGESEDGALTGFVIRRVIGIVAVLFAVSALVFVVFILVPGGDPAQRMAGKNPLPANIENIRKKWGFDRPFYVQYVRMMQKAFNGILPGKHGEYDILTSFQ